MRGSWGEYSNCGSYVYHYFGLISKDIYTKDIGIARTWGELLVHFSEVSGITNANVLAIVVASEGVLRMDSRLSHLAVVGNDKKTVSHRPGDMADVGHNIPVQKVLEQYLVDRQRIEKYLVLRN